MLQLDQEEPTQQKIPAEITNNCLPTPLTQRTYAMIGKQENEVFKLDLTQKKPNHSFLMARHTTIYRMKTEITNRPLTQHYPYFERKTHINQMR